MKKKLLSTPIIIAIFIALSSLTGFAIEKIGEVYGTMYMAQINCEQIPLYIYNGYPYIVAEDLGGYGFDVKWDAYTDILDIQYNPDKKFYPYADFQCNFDPLSQKVSDVYTSNTVVKLQGDIIPAYSLNGRMIISLDEFWRFGSVNWYDDSTTISFLTNEFMQNNPDWQILVPAWCLWYNLNTVYECNAAGWDREVFEYVYSGDDSYFQSSYLSALQAREFITDKLSKIENNNLLYYKGYFYNFTYSILDDLNDTISDYQLVMRYSSLSAAQKAYRKKQENDILYYNDKEQYGYKLFNLIYPYLNPKPEIESSI